MPTTAFCLAGEAGISVIFFGIKCTVRRGDSTYTMQIAEKVGIPQQCDDFRTSVLQNRSSKAAADHATDFVPPIYNIWKFKQKTESPSRVAKFLADTPRTTEAAQERRTAGRCLLGVAVQRDRRETAGKRAARARTDKSLRFLRIPFPLGLNFSALVLAIGLFLLRGKE